MIFKIIFSVLQFVAIVFFVTLALAASEPWRTGSWRLSNFGQFGGFRRGFGGTRYGSVRGSRQHFSGGFRQPSRGLFRGRGYGRIKRSSDNKPIPKRYGELRKSTAFERLERSQGSRKEFDGLGGYGGFRTPGSATALVRYGTIGGFSGVGHRG